MLTPHRYDEEGVRTILEYISPDINREDWALVAMGVKNELGDTGFSVFDAWSKRGDSYDANDCKSTWRSVKADGGVSIGTVIKMAMQNGFKPGHVTPVEIDPEAERRRKHEQELAEVAKKNAQRKAALTAERYWGAGIPAEEHPYLTKKNAKAYGLRAGAFPTGDTNQPGALLIPVTDAKTDKIISIQGIIITAAGETRKLFLKDGRMSGGCFFIGTPANGKIIAFAEGYATGATIHELTGWTVCVTFNCGNIQNVATTLRQRFPAAPFIFCADNDRATEGNPGVTNAQKAGKQTNGYVLVPEFTGDEGTDFNDLCALMGSEAARKQLLKNPISNPTAEQPDYQSPLPDVNSRGKPYNTIENLIEIMRRVGFTVRYNVITKEEELIIPGEAFSVDNRGNASFAQLESKCARFNMATDKLQSFLTYLADKNPYNPVAEWIDSKPWDGQSRLQDLFDTITPVAPVQLSNGTLLHEVLLKRWLLSAVAAIYEPDGVSAPGILVLQGAQYMGKTLWFKRLAPESLGVVQDGLILRPDDRDSIKQACSFWLVELGELDATFRKADIAALKSFITRKQDVLRLAYARKESKYPRRTVFFGSVNPHDFLRDATGNRRYWTISCKNIDCNHHVDMQQLWAELKAIWLKGEPFYLTQEEMTALNAENENFQVIDPVEQCIQKLPWGSDPKTWRWMSATEILQECGLDHPGIPEATRAGLIVRKLNGNQSRRETGGKRTLLCPVFHRAYGWNN